MGKNDIESLKRPSLPSSGGQPGRDESSSLFDSLSPRPAKTSSAFSNSLFFHRRFSSLMQTMSNHSFTAAHSHSTTIRPLFFGHPLKPTLQAWSLFVQSFPSEQLGLHSRLLKGDECLILLEYIIMHQSFLSQSLNSAYVASLRTSLSFKTYSCQDIPTTPLPLKDWKKKRSSLSQRVRHLANSSLLWRGYLNNIHGLPPLTRTKRQLVHLGQAVRRSLFLFFLRGHSSMHPRLFAYVGGH